MIIISEFRAKIIAELDTSKVEQQINQLNGKNVKFNVDTGKTQKDINEINNAINSTYKTASSLSDTLKKSLNIGSAAAITAKGFQLIKTAANNAIEAVKELDGAIVDLQMATNQGYEQTRQLVAGYNQMAKDLGAVTTQVTTAADSWLRQGNSINDTNTLIRDSMILSKVGQLDSADATQYLTSSMKGYKIEAEGALSIVDKLTAVDLESATDAGGLAEGMSEVAVTAENAGISMDKLLGYLASVGEVTQESMTTIGTSFKTIFTRMSDIKTNKFELIDEDGTTEILSDVEQTLANVGIDLRRTVTEYNNYGDVLDSLAAKWNTLNQVQQNALAKAFAGTRQQNRFRVLMENYDNAKKYMEVAANSAGTAENKFNAYLNSIEAKVNSLQAAFESLVFDSSLSNMFSGIVEASTAILEFVDKTNLLQGALAGLGTAGAIEGFKALMTGIQNSAVQMSNFHNALQMVNEGTALTDNNFKQLLTMTNNLSQSQLKAVLSSQALNTEQRITILTSQGMTKAQAEAALSSMGLATAEGTATASTVTLSGALKGLWATLMANPLILIIAGVTAGVMAISALNDAAEEARQKAIDAGNAAIESGNDIYDAAVKYLELKQAIDNGTGSSEDFAAAQSEVLEAVNLSGEGVDKLIEKYGSLYNAIIKASQEQLKTDISVALAGVDNAAEQAGKDITSWLGTSVSTGDVDIFKSLEEANYISKGSFGSAGGQFSAPNLDFDDLFDKLALEEALENMRFYEDVMNHIRDNFGTDNDTFKKTAEAYNEYAESLNPVIEQIDNANQLIAQSLILDAQANGNINSLEEYIELRQNLINDLTNNQDFVKGGNMEASGLIDTLLSGNSEYSEFYAEFSKLEEIENKYSSIKKNFSNSKWFKDADWTIAEQRLNNFNDWFDNLSDYDKEIVYNISCNTDTAEFNLEDWQNALENYSIYTKQSTKDIENNVARATESTKTLISGISSAQDALSSQSTGTSLSIKDFNSEELADYTAALEYHNGVMQLNADKVSEIIKAKSQEQIEINNTNKAMAQSTYLDNAAQIEKLRQKIKDKNFAEGESEESIQNSINALLDENSAIKSNCDAYDLMTASLQEATDKYHNWLNAQKAAQSGDMFDDTLDAINRINETLNNTDSEYYGRVGRTDYQAAINLIIPDAINPEDEAKVNAYLNSIYDMFTYDDNGNRAGLNIENFCQKTVDKGLMVFDEATNSYQIAGQKTMADFAEGMNMTLPLVQAMFGEMEEFGGEFSWADEAVKTIGDLGVAANESAEALRQIKGNEDLEIKLDVSEIESTDEKISTLESTIKTMQDVKGKANVDASEVEYANQIIEYCIAQKQNLSSPIVMSVDTTAISEKNAEIIGKIQEFKRACNDLELKQSLGVDTKDAKAKVSSLAGELKNIDANILAQLNLDPTSVESLKTSINNITGDQLLKIGIDDSAIIGWTADNKQATVTYDVDSTEVDTYKKQDDSKTATVTFHRISTEIDQYNPKNLTRTVTYNIKTKGSAGGGIDINGTAHASGTAYASGNWSAKQGGDTLVGELGREIVVDPHTGRWYTVGDVGAEFVSIPKGAIVFNHKQTESLLANGYVSSRASALVNGTAMVTGGISAKNAKNSTKSGGNSTNNYSKSKSSSSSESSSKSSNKDEKEPQIFDWIEVALSRIQRTIDNLSKKAESTFKKLSTRLKATNDEISNVNTEINLQQQAADRYMREANSVGLSSGLSKQVREGSIQISEYDEDTQKLIEDYQKWYILCHSINKGGVFLFNCWKTLKLFKLQHNDEICVSVKVVKAEKIE